MYGLENIYYDFTSVMKFYHKPYSSILVYMTMYIYTCTCTWFGISVTFSVVSRVWSSSETMPSMTALVELRSTGKMEALGPGEVSSST